MLNKRIVYLISGLLLSCTVMSATYYVTTTGSDDDDGSSWATSFKTIAKSLSVVEENDQVWIAQGRYPETVDLNIAGGISLYGGFYGNEQTLEERTDQFETVIDMSSKIWTLQTYGYLEGVSVTGYCNLGSALSCMGGTIEKCKVYENESGGIYILDGLVSDCDIYENRGPEEALYKRGGVTVYRGSIEKSRIFNNSTYGNGGGIYCNDGTITNCDVYSNRSNAREVGDGSNGGGGIWLDNGTVSDCRVHHNYAQQRGGGIRAITGGTIDNCIVYSNESEDRGGGIYSSGDVSNCLVYNNTARIGGGGISIFQALLINCTVFGNKSSYNACGIEADYYVKVQNCISWGHECPDLLSSDSCEVKNSCFREAIADNQNISQNPLFINVEGPVSTWNLHLQDDSPCIDSGLAENAPDTDLDGISRPHGSGMDIGCYEFHQELVPLFTASETKGYSQLDVDFHDDSIGNPDAWTWDFDNDGIIDSNEQHPSWHYAAPGLYTVSLVVSKEGLSKAVVKYNYITIKNVYFVSTDGSDDNNGNSWADSLKTISGALFRTGWNDVVWVSLGNYQEGGVLNVHAYDQVFGGFAGNETSLNQRNVELYKACIDGEESYQCVFNSGLLDGFDIINGRSVDGGGIHNKGYVQNCRIYECQAESKGGGIYGDHGSLIKNTEIFKNTAQQGGGIYADCSVVTQCALYENSAEEGGGVNSSSGNISQLHVFKNYATGNGGGVYSLYSNYTNSLIYANIAEETGGGLFSVSSEIDHCTVYGNISHQGASGGFFENASIYNSIFWNNGSSDFIADRSTRFSFLCYPESGSTNGNIALDPLFQNISGNPDSWDLRLQANSPCINMGGSEKLLTYDLDGMNRYENDLPDMGCYEFHDRLFTISSDKQSGTAGLSVLFSAQSVDEITAYLWDFDNDGTIDSSEISPVWTYLTPGVYSVTLSVEFDGEERTRTWKNYIHVLPQNTSELSAEITASTIPSEMFPGLDHWYCITVKNTGSEVWTRNGTIKLGAVGDSDPFTAQARFTIPYELAYGDEYTFYMKMNPSEEGDFLTDWQMMKEGVAWFGEKLEQLVHVQSSTDIYPGLWSVYR